jgi:hypothetical protein
MGVFDMRKLAGLIATIWIAATGMAPTATAASLKDVVGTWTFVSNTAVRDGNKIELFGPGGRGQMILSADGRYMIVIVRADLPKFGKNSRFEGTPEENRAVLQGSNAHYGSFSVDEAAGVLTFNIEGATFPNWTGAVQRRQFTLTGDVLTYIIPTSTTGSGSGEVIWKRTK